jgi:altronate hydrolase
MLTRRAISPEVGKKLVDRILWWEDYVTRNKGSLNNNPSPGNKAGGLTTILEKSLGAAAKGGTTPLNDVLLYAEEAKTKGFLFMDSPGYDPASVTGQIASGCNVVTFTTGRGSCFGCKPSPSIKIATNTEMYKNMVEDMDVNAGKVITDSKSIEDVGQEIFDLIVRVASGEKSKSEAQGLGDLEFVPWQIGATM